MINIDSAASYGNAFNEAERLRDEDKIHEAADYYLALLKFRIEWESREPGLPYTINEFYIVDRLADISLLLGNKKAARLLLSAASNKAKIAGNAVFRIHAVTKLLFVNLHDGDIDGAIKNINSIEDIIGDIKKIQITAEGLTVWEDKIAFDHNALRQNKTDQCVCLYDALGNLLLALGQFTDGCLMLQRGIEIGIKAPSPVVESRILSMQILLAKGIFQKGDIKAANDILINIEKFSGIDKISSGIPIHLLDLKSKIFLAQGDMGEAYLILSKIVELCNQHKLYLAKINANFNVAQIKILLNQVDEATEILTDCFILARKFEDFNLAGRISSFLKVVDDRFRATLPSLNYGSSKQLFVANKNQIKESISTTNIYKRSSDYVSFWGEHSLLFQIFLAEGKHEKAQELLSQFNLLIKGCDSTLLQVRFRIMEFMFLYYSNSTLPKELLFKPVLNFLQKNNMLPELWQFRNLLGHTDLIPDNDKAAWINENHNILEKVTSSLPPDMRALYLLNKWTTNEEYLSGYSDSLLLLKQRAKNSKFFGHKWLAGWKLMKSLHFFQEETKQYKNYLARNVTTGVKHNNFIPDQKGTSILTRLWTQPKHILSVSFLILPDRIIIISRSFLRIRLHITYISRIQLRQLIFNLRDQLSPSGMYRGVGRSTSKKVPEIEMHNLQSHVEKILQIDNILNEHGTNIHGITFVADDILHGFPFTLLNANGKALIIDYKINLSIDDELTDQDTIIFTHKKALLAGVSINEGAYRNLPGVEKEINEVSDLLRKSNAETTVLMNETASVKEVAERLLTAEIAHFSCHGKFDYEKPGDSGLLLWQGQMISLRDILLLNKLKKLDLVVLSSCRGAEHYILPGRWVIGMPETFCRAGAKTVLAFLWPVNDDFATAFTVNFYESLKKHPPAEAFRLTILKATNKQFPNLNINYWEPEFWAGAILYQS